MPLIVTRTARSIIYLLCIGGLLALNGLIVTVLWNKVFRSEASAAGELSFLEGTGITAFAYVIVLAIRYGIRSVPANDPNVGIIPECDHEMQPAGNHRYAHLTSEQRTALKQELVRSCGCRETRTEL